MTRIKGSENGTTIFESLLGHNLDILNSWVNLEKEFLGSATFTAAFKEELRRNLAQINGCEYCKAKGAPLESYEDKKLSIAVEFLKTAANNRYKVGEEAFNRLKEVFSDEEISELCSFIAFITACQNFGAMMELKPVCSIE
ncbi:carboxymuconolactone decarboxylase family protein [Clostridium manihotivorum]|uniref:Alkylhydroperoxidase n=1 Tax=Clostridium manihotivorum TaxID=2320868 RepID=A0A410DN32_9CLOT|nr:carboxymuconolactone decarboxylase family protein [Clostridium manihotivorum]QAA30457.1 alkylhydroperoxidase [Clostridium manihotivorum]